MNTKKFGLAMLSLIIVATVAGALIYSMQLTVKGDTSNAVVNDAETVTEPLAVDGTELGLNNHEDRLMMLNFESRFVMGHRGEPFRMGGFQGIQLSSEFTQNVTNIAQSDSDVQDLLSQNYNITSIRPVITSIIDGDGNIVTTASTANVLLQGENGSKAFVVVDLSQAKVTKIVTLAVTVIEK